MIGFIERGARAAGLFAICGLAVLSLVPGFLRPHTGLPGHDEHALAYALTGTALALGYPTVFARCAWWGVLTIVAGVFEALQNLVPDRSPAVMDAVASSIGLAVGLGVGAALLKALRENSALRKPLGPTAAR